MKKTLGYFCVALECLLFLWLTVGLWACANKIREMENWHNERLESIQTFDLPENKLNALVIALHKLQQDTDILRIRIDDLEEFMGLDPATGIEEMACGQAGDKFLVVDELRLKVDALDARVKDLESIGK